MLLLFTRGLQACLVCKDRAFSLQNNLNVYVRDSCLGSIILFYFCV